MKNVFVLLALIGLGASFDLFSASDKEVNLEDLREHPVFHRDHDTHGDESECLEALKVFEETISGWGANIVDLGSLHRILLPSHRADKSNQWNEKFAVRHERLLKTLLHQRQNPEAIEERARAKGLDLAIYHQAATNDSAPGDGYLLLEAKDHFGFVVFDVDGKGLIPAKAALFVNQFLSSSKITQNYDERTAMDLLTSLDKVYVDSRLDIRNKMVYISHVKISKHTGVMQYAAAGLGPNLVLKKDGFFRILNSNGIPIVLSSNPLNPDELSFTQMHPSPQTDEKLEEGDNLIIMTDGIMDRVCLGCDLSFYELLRKISHADTRALQQMMIEEKEEMSFLLGLMRLKGKPAKTVLDYIIKNSIPRKKEGTSEDRLDDRTIIVYRRGRDT